MVETASDIESNPESVSVSVSKTSEEGKDTVATTTDIHNTPVKIERAREAYKGYTEVNVGMPAKQDVWVWYLYELCSYFIHTVLLPVLFPLYISQIKHLLQEPDRVWERSPKGLFCRMNEVQLYGALTYRSIAVSSLKFSALEWTSFSWAVGLIVSAPVLGSIATHIDYGRNQLPIAGAAISIGCFFCLPTGFFKVTWVFLPYTVAIVTASIVAKAFHTRHFGIMVRGFIGPTIQKSRFPFRRGVSSWLSLSATAAGSLGAAIISAFTYYMLEHKEKTLSLWIVSIYSGLLWAVGISHILFTEPGAPIASTVSSIAHTFAIFKYPHALGSLIMASLSSFTSMCIFTSTVLYLLGQQCFKPVFMLYLWLTYFIFPLVSMPLMQPLQHLVKANAVKMHLLGFYLSILTSGVGFYFRGKIWQREHVLIFAAIQSTSVGLLHAYGRVLLIDCSPNGKDGAFSAWFSWSTALGTCAGFAVASTIPGNVGISFGVAFCTAIAGALILVYGNISDYEGAIAAGNVSDDTEERGSPVHGLDSSIAKKDDVQEKAT